MLGSRYSVLLAVAFGAILLGCLDGCSRPSSRAFAASAGAEQEATTSQPILSSFEDLANTRFAPVRPDPYEPPRVVKIPIPKIEGVSAGARSDRGSRRRRVRAQARERIP